MSQQGFLMKRSGGKFTGSSYGNRKNKLDRRWFRIREGALYYYAELRDEGVDAPRGQGGARGHAGARRWRVA